MSAWRTHLRAFRGSHPQLSLKQCMQQASLTYKKAPPKYRAFGGNEASDALYIGHGTTWHVATGDQFRKINAIVKKEFLKKGYGLDVMSLSTAMGELGDFEIDDVKWVRSARLLSFKGNEAKVLQKPRKI